VTHTSVGRPERNQVVRDTIRTVAVSAALLIVFVAVSDPSTTDYWLVLIAGAFLVLVFEGAGNRRM